MFMICDKNDVIQDLATEKANLARGYDFEDHKLYENVNIGNGTIGDKYKDGLVLIDIDQLAARELRNHQEILIGDKKREIAIAELKKEGKLPPDFEELAQ